MVSSRLIASACIASAIGTESSPIFHMFEEDGLQLLQVAAKKHNQTDGEMMAPGRNSGLCAMGGDTHVSSWYAAMGHKASLDPMQRGLFNYANSKDGRFRSQVYQCNVPYQKYGWINAMAFEIDGTQIQILPPIFGEILTRRPSYTPIYIRADGKEYLSTDLPFTIPGTTIEIRAHKPDGLVIVTDGFSARVVMPTYGGVGRVDQSWAYVATWLHLQPDNVPDLDENSFCVKGQAATPIVDASSDDWSASIFSNADHQRICDFCESWNQFPRYMKPENKFQCHQPPPPPPPVPAAKTECDKNECSWKHSQQLCHSLEGDEVLYNDCLFDFCVGCDDEAAARFVDDQEDEFPGPVCVAGAPECAPEEVCSKSVTMNTLTVSQNNLGGVGPDSGAEEIRYSNAAVVNGKAVDLVLTTDGEFKSSKPAKNGKSGAFGVLNVKCGSSVTVFMKVVDSESGASVTLDAVSLTWYDLDEGKKEKGRATITTCGSTGAMVSQNTELTVIREGDCSRATSSVAGTGKDNPKSPHTLDSLQLSRSLTLPFKQVSEWSSTLSLDKGHKGRNFMFALEPSVACGLPRE